MQIFVADPSRTTACFLAKPAWSHCSPPRPHCPQEEDRGPSGDVPRLAPTTTVVTSCISKVTCCKFPPLEAPSCPSGAREQRG